AIADRFGQLTCCPLCAISNDLPAYVFAWIAQVSESRRSRSQWLMLPSCVRKGVNVRYASRRCAGIYGTSGSLRSASSVS
ncbi:MAG: hypothetical protein KDE01_26950, partial [Caldilineaceae bacterium]|nr:hypothetical protein [Caldilineaceae bacterium]